MKTIPLTRGYVALVDDEDFDVINKYKWTASVYKSGRVCAVRAIKKDGKWTSLLMHRAILMAPGDMDIDHINHNAIDNRKTNLRIVTRQDNAKNKALSSTNSSGNCGVYWDSANQKWRAQLTINGRLKSLGRFLLKEDAISAWESAKFEHYYHKNHGIPRERWLK